MFGCWFSPDVKMPDGSERSLKDSVPFREVYIHALVRDANREKMSKTKGNVIDPIEIVKQYGTDAVRFTLASMASPGTDIAFNMARTEGYRAFANKIWNAARFIFMHRDRFLGERGAVLASRSLDLQALDREDAVFLGQYPPNPNSAPHGQDAGPLEHRWIISRLHGTATAVNTALENYRFDEAASTIYQFFWGDFCDWYLEIIKISLDEEADSQARILALLTLLAVFESSLRLLAPFMPFLTEELWHAYHNDRAPAKSIGLMPYPRTKEPVRDDDPEQGMALLQSLIVEIRALRKEIGVEEKAAVPVEFRAHAHLRQLAEENRDIIERLARVSEVRFVDQITVGLSKHSTAEFDVAVVYEKKRDIAAEREKLTKDMAKLRADIANGERQLNNPGFTGKAPAHIVEGLTKQVEEKRQLLDKLGRDLDALPPE